MSFVVETMHVKALVALNNLPSIIFSSSGAVIMKIIKAHMSISLSLNRKGSNL